ncbi:hypothetical protein EWM64_g2076 [Hericium alpestre]|uniref:Uncharacterized protein n=1 Tax=Hericium alpestre TaxID=135208 RepID=A0A4Z0A8M2_9AGAM|nr:hypothetical protein EWM64_g2076 [Hericium alpestre]
MADTERQFVGAPNYLDAGHDQYLQLPFGAGYTSQAQPVHPDAPLQAQWDWPPYPPLQTLPYPISSDYHYANAGLSIVDPYPFIPTIDRPSAPSQHARSGTEPYRLCQTDALAVPGTNEGRGGAISQMVDYNPDEPHGMTLWAPRPLHAASTMSFIQGMTYTDAARQSPPMRALGAPLDKGAPDLALHPSAPLSVIGAAYTGIGKLEPTYQVVEQDNTICSAGAQYDASAYSCGGSSIVQSASSVPLTTSNGALTISRDADGMSGAASTQTTSSTAHYAAHNASGDISDASSDVPIASSIINNASRGLGRPRKLPTGGIVKKRKKVKAPPVPKKLQFLACFFCRGRKIACGHPPPDRVDRTCK